MTIKFSPTSGFIRLYKGDNSYENKDPYDFICTLIFLTESKVYLCGAKGELSKNDLMDIKGFLKDLGVKEVEMERHGEIKRLNI